MAELLRHLPLAAAFVLGACAATAVQSSASPTAQPTAMADTTPTDEPGPAPVWPRVTSAAQAEQRVAPNGKARVTILARGRQAFMARLELDPGAAVPEHRDATEEYVYVLAGSGTMTIDDHVFEISTGDTVYMPAQAKVSVHNGDAPLVGLQVFAGPEPAVKYDAWTPVP